MAAPVSPRPRTAMITGATAGLGTEYAVQLARRGFGLVLVARDAQRLEALAVRLRADHDVDVEVLPADLTTDDGCAAAAVRLTDRRRPVDVLVNNAGFGLRERFVDSALVDQERLLDLLVRAVLRLSHAAAEPMAERGRGCVINVASVAAFLPGGTYTAAKAWVVAFTRGLAAELHGTGVGAVAVCPGFVHTEFHQRAGMDMSRIPSWCWLDAPRVVADSLDAAAHGRTVVVPSRRYRVLVTLLRHVPIGVADRLLQTRGGRLPLRD